MEEEPERTEQQQRQRHRRRGQHRREEGREEVGEEGPPRVRLSERRGQRIPAGRQDRPDVTRRLGEARPRQGEVTVAQLGSQLHRQLGMRQRHRHHAGVERAVGLPHLAEGEGDQVLDGQLAAGGEHRDGGRGGPCRVLLAEGGTPL